MAMMESTMAQMQLVTNVIKDFHISFSESIGYDESVNINGEFTINILAIEKIEKEQLKGEMELNNKIIIKKGEKEVGNIYISVFGIFIGEKLTEENFEKMMKINGAAVLYSITRAFVQSVTAQAVGMPINIPLVNFDRAYANTNKKE